MKLAEAKEEFRKIVAGYFGSDHVFYANSKMAKLPEPYITIHFTGITRQTHETRIQFRNGDANAYRQIEASVDVNLYTKGRSIDGSKTVYADTALDDMIGFLDYVQSNYGLGVTRRNNMAILVASQPKDMSALIREAQYQYRAMAEFTVRFTDMTNGEFYQNNNELPNSSGGGNKSMITEPSWIEEVEVAQTESEQNEGGTE